LFARDGLLRGNIAAWKDYLRVDFHPLDHDASDSERWLKDNHLAYNEVSRPAQPRLAA
jgi:predicted metal-dependent hydrolase